MTAAAVVLVMVGALTVGLEVFLFLATPSPFIGACLVITALFFVINVVTFMRAVR